MLLALILLLAPNVVFAARPVKRFYDTHNYYALEHNPTGVPLVDILRALHVELVEQVGELKDHWLVRQKKPDEDDLTAREEDSDRVLERFEHLRSIADHQNNFWSRSEDEVDARGIVDSVFMLERQELRQRYKRAPPPVHPTSARAVAQRFGINDPLFPKQWHLVNEEHPEHTMNVTGVWEMGITGKGVISTFIDDGLDYNAMDLKDNFVAEFSHDYNDHKDLPTPSGPVDHHGTRCAGQVAAGKNSYCGIGIAYESKAAGVRILSGPISDVDESAALNFGFQNVSIYSCSWGPPDNGEAMAGPNRLIRKAILNGINHGRGGKGSIFVFASGNGAHHGDQCNFDGYTNSIYSVTVSAVDWEGHHPYYSEPCAANMIVAYSSGAKKHIVTTDIGVDKCSERHGGTSAAAPNAAGVLALVLQVRPDLTWRDIQYLCIKTARILNPDDDWETIATGQKYSYKYGFGAIDGYAIVKAAQDWKLVKPQTWVKTPTTILGGGRMTTTGHGKHALYHYTGGEPIPSGGITNSIKITEEMLIENNFDQLEHLNVKVWIQHDRRGDVEVEIVSPNGIKSMLAGSRDKDDSKDGFPGWIFMSVKHWGEHPVGNWTIRVKDQAKENKGHFLGWSMTFWGSAIDPAQAVRFEEPPEDNHVLPPPDEADNFPTPSMTQSYIKPTHFLTDDHETSTATDTSSTSKSTTTGTSTGSDWLSETGSVVSNHKTSFGGFALFVLIIIGVGIFFWRRRVAQRKRDEYRSVAGEDVAMTGLERQPLAPRDRYDDEGDAGADVDPRRRPEGLGFHSAFLDDDEPPSAAAYKDEPDPRDRGQSPSGER